MTVTQLDFRIDIRRCDNIMIEQEFTVNYDAVTQSYINFRQELPKAIADSGEGGILIAISSNIWELFYFIFSKNIKF